MKKLKNKVIRWLVSNYSYCCEYHQYYKYTNHFNKIKYQIFIEETIMNFLIFINKKFNMKLNDDITNIERYF